MDFTLLDQLEDHSPAPAVGDGQTVRRLRQLWLAGMPLARAAAAVRITYPEAEGWLSELGLPATAGRKRVDVDLLRRLYVDEGLPVADIADRLGISEDLVRSRVSNARLRRVRTDHSAIVVRLYRRGQSIRVIAGTLDLHPRTVWRLLDEAGMERRPVGSLGRRLRKADLQRLYVRGGLSMAEVARRLDVHEDVVRRNLDRLGLPRRDRQVPVDRARLEQLYVVERLGVRAVAIRLGISASKVRRDLTAHGIPIRRPGRPAQT